MLYEVITLLLLRNTGTQRLADYLGDLLTGRDSVKEVRLFQLQDVLLDRFDDSYRMPGN